MAQTNVNIRMDENLKKQFDILCSELGLSMSSAINIFAKTVVREQRIPFELSLDVPNKETIAAMQEVDDMIRSGTGKKYNSIEELFKELDS